MAKKQRSFDIERVTATKAKEELSDLRSGRGGRTSKYLPVAEEAQELNKGQVLKLKVKKNEVGGLRGYLRRRYGDQFTVKSSRLDGDEYMAFVFHSEDEDDS